MAEKKEKRYVSDNAQLMAEWDWEKNIGQFPDTITLGSGKKVWWKCEKGHEWQATIDHRSRGNGCPYCSGRYAVKGENDLETVNPTLAKEWNYEKNFPLKPEDVSYSSGMSVWWKCGEGHIWKAAINNRIRWSGCPYCSNKKVWKGFNDFNSQCKANNKEKLLKEWVLDKNSNELNITSDSVLYGSDKYAWWKCSRCGYEWKAKIYARTGRGDGCPNCRKEFKVSFNEKMIYYYVHKHCKNAVENYTDFSNSKLELDIYLPDIKLGIEYDGQYYHTNIQRDEQKNEICNSEGIDLVRIREPKCPRLNGQFTEIKLHSLKEDDIIAAVKELLQILNKKYSIHNEIDIDLNRDRGEIYNLIESREKENSLLKLYPEIAKEWHPIKNGSLSPENVRYASGKKIWWLCSKCSNEWVMTVNQRALRGQGCPECGKIKRVTSFNKSIVKERGSLVQHHPELLADWDYEKNSINPNDVSNASNKKVYWKCNVCGHEWCAEIQSRTIGGNGCPSCRNIKFGLKRKTPIKGNSFAEKYPELLSAWDYEKNLLSPYEYKPKSNQIVVWKCLSCGKSYESKISYKVTNYEKSGYIDCISCNKKKSWAKRKQREKRGV